MSTMDSYDGSLNSNSLIYALIVFMLNTNVAMFHEKGIKSVPMIKNADMTGDELTTFLTLDTKAWTLRHILQRQSHHAKVELFLGFRHITSKRFPLESCI